MGHEPILVVEDLNRSFDHKKVIHHVSFTVDEGDIFGFLGPNGCGKTTIIRMILGLIKPDSGTVKINGYDIKKEFLKAVAHVGAVVETPTFYTNLTGYQNLLLIKNLYPNLSKSRIDEVLQLVGLSSKAKNKVSTYSLGMKQRLGLARTLLNHPKIVFLDEPTNGIDPKGVSDLRELIVSLAKKENITFFITSHILHEIEQVCNKVAVLKEGHLIAIGTVKDLISKDTEKIEIVTTSKKQAIALIAPISYVESVVESEEGIIVTLEKNHTNQLNRLLIENGVDLAYVIPKNQSLESIFFELTGGDDSNG
ncbi:ABC transporter ATP-binding protein [Anaerobacillus sp. MEB173]|uniref:ABC transporter ATP-binding protein n=1 Tax=Anaerobacillus sp. MEB173 TaxID=3383345 RepID=UPI003F8EC5E8